MDSETVMAAARLHDRANHLRQLAMQARSRGVGAELERIARHYEADASHIELHGMTGQMSGMR
jgi:hypothetical protein